MNSSQTVGLQLARDARDGGIEDELEEVVDAVACRERVWGEVIIGVAADGHDKHLSASAFVKQAGLRDSEFKRLILLSIKLTSRVKDLMVPQESLNTAIGTLCGADLRCARFSLNSSMYGAAAASFSSLVMAAQSSCTSWGSWLILRRGSPGERAVR